MRVAVFGTDQQSTALLARWALRIGYDVSVMVAAKQYMPLHHDDLRTVVGSLRDPAKVREAMFGAHAVIGVFDCNLGGAERSLNLIAHAMRAGGVDRLVVSVDANTDIACLYDSGLEWTVIRPLELVRQLQAQMPQSNQSHRMQATAAPLAEVTDFVSIKFLVSQICDSRFVGQSIALSQ